jgi:hypothetical protein
MSAHNQGLATSWDADVDDAAARAVANFTVTFRRVSPVIGASGRPTSDPAHPCAGA